MRCNDRCWMFACDGRHRDKPSTTEGEETDAMMMPRLHFTFTLPVIAVFCLTFLAENGPETEHVPSFYSVIK